MIIPVFIFGLIIGSFLNAVIWRLHTNRNLWGRSQCTHCHKIIFWYDNIPLLSFILLGGKCRHCHKKISWQYPMVELATAILFVLAYIQLQDQVGIVNKFPISLRAYGLVEPEANFPLTLSPSPLGGEGWGEGFWLIRDFVFISFLIIIFVYDLRYMYILDIITLPAAVIAFFLNLALGMSWKDLILGAIIGAGFFLAQFLLSRGKWIGGGDIRLGAVMGFMLGWKMILVALFLSYAFGAIISVLLILFRHKKFSSKIPFGTFLSAATIVTLFWGEAILKWYWNIIRL